MRVRPVLRQRIQDAQSADPQLSKISEKIGQGVNTPFSIQDGILMYGARMCIPDVNDLRKEILDEAQNASYAMHPGTTKMYQTLRQH